MSVLLVEHDMGFVMDLADRVVVLEFGTKIAEARRQTFAPTRTWCAPISERA